MCVLACANTHTLPTCSNKKHQQQIQTSQLCRNTQLCYPISCLYKQSLYSQYTPLVLLTNNQNKVQTAEERVATKIYHSQGQAPLIAACLGSCSLQPPSLLYTWEGYYITTPTAQHAQGTCACIVFMVCC